MTMLFDPNIWYTFIYASATQTLALGRSSDTVNYRLAVQLYVLNSSDETQRWQILSSPNRPAKQYFLLRASLSPAIYYLAAYCDGLTECDVNTLGGLRTSNSPDSAPVNLRWNNTSTTSETVQIGNLANTTDLALGAQGLYIHMLNVSTSWIVMPGSKINDDRFSTIIAATAPMSAATSISSSGTALLSPFTTKTSISATSVSTEGTLATTDNSSATTSSLPAVKIAGIVIGSVVILALVGFASWWLLRRHRRRNARTTAGTELVEVGQIPAGISSDLRMVKYTGRPS